MRSSTPVVLLALVAAGAAAQPRDEALRIVERWTTAFGNADVEGITSLYAPDATFLGTGSTGVLTSHAAIRGYFERALLVDRPRTATVTDVVVTVLSPNEVVVTGTDVVTRVRDGATISAAGRVTFVVVERDGEWRIAHFHRSAMPAASAAFTALFDGTLHGATIENDGAFTIANGVLRAEGPSGWLRFEPALRDFRLRAELRFVTETADSGIFFRAQGGDTFGRGWPNRSYQVQLLHPAAAGRLPPLGGLFRHGMPPGDTELDQDRVGAAFTGTNEWQTLEIELIGPRLTVELNGVLVTRATDVAEGEGAIGIQSETSAVEFRRLEVQRLDAGR